VLYCVGVLTAPVPGRVATSCSCAPWGAAVNVARPMGRAVGVVCAWPCLGCVRAGRASRAKVPRLSRVWKPRYARAPTRLHFRAARQAGGRFRRAGGQRPLNTEANRRQRRAPWRSSATTDAAASHPRRRAVSPIRQPPHSPPAAHYHQTTSHAPPSQTQAAPPHTPRPRNQAPAHPPADPANAPLSAYLVGLLVAPASNSPHYPSRPPRHRRPPAHAIT